MMQDFHRRGSDLLLFGRNGGVGVFTGWMFQQAGSQDYAVIGPMVVYQYDFQVLPALFENRADAPFNSGCRIVHRNND
jgi:hypothetical protein